MKNNLEDAIILSVPVLHALDFIIQRNPEVVFGGSLALNAVGLIHRPIKDLDIVLPKHNRNPLREFISPDENNELSETTTDVNGQQIRRVHARVLGINVCIFYFETVQSSVFSFLKRRINIQNCNEIVLAKLAFSRKEISASQKHKEDLPSIAGTLDEVTDDLPF